MKQRHSLLYSGVDLHLLESVYHLERSPDLLWLKRLAEFTKTDAEEVAQWFHFKNANVLWKVMNKLMLKNLRWKVLQELIFSIQISLQESQNDCYCWICHKEGDVICCETCPRVFHLKCIQLENAPTEDWVCPECVLIMTAENMDTRSRAMRLLTVDQLCVLLRHALARMRTVSGVEPFTKPVDINLFPAYRDYVFCPMDLTTVEKNIKKKQYGSTEAFLADVKWILHNCIIFNSLQSKLTSIAKSLVKICKHEMQEIENCPDCYLNAHSRKDSWFTCACVSFILNFPRLDLFLFSNWQLTSCADQLI